MHITVGTKRGDVVGNTGRALQIAADALAASGGGTLEIGPGTYHMEDALRISSRVRVVGAGAKTVLRKCDGPSSALTIDADYGQLKLTAKDAEAFRPGMGIIVGDGRHGGWHATTARIVSIVGKHIHIDEHLLSDYAVESAAFVRNACSLISCIDVEDVSIENLTVDGNKSKNQEINGCRGGGIYLHKARRCRVAACSIVDFSGDGLSWQITQDVTVDGCVIERSSGTGIHPGTGSERTVIRNCISRANGLDGMFVCWRVQGGLIEGCRFTSNGRHGVSIGHKDTENQFRRNTISGNGFAGIHFRDEKQSNAANDNSFESNTIEDNGRKHPSPAIEILGSTTGLVFARNIIRPGKAPSATVGQRSAFLLGPKAARPELKANRIAKHKDGVTVRAADVSL